MRLFGFVGVMTFLVPTAVFSQTAAPSSERVPASPTQPAAIDPGIKSQLESLVKVLVDATNYHSKGTVKLTNTVTKKTSEKIFEVQCMKPHFAKMTIEPAQAPGVKTPANEFTQYLYAGASIFEYDGGSKTRTEYKIRLQGNPMLDLMSGKLGIPDALLRYEIKALPKDENYYYYEVKPRNPRDKVEFETLTIALFQPNPRAPQRDWLPALLVLNKNNGQEREEWNFLVSEVNSKTIKAADFKPVEPNGWTIVVKEPPQANPKRGNPSDVRPVSK